MEGATGKNPHFGHLSDWPEVAPLVDFEPLVPGYTAGLERQWLAVFVKDHRKRDVPRSRRAVEAHYGDFVFSQSMPGEVEARRLALSSRYGAESTAVTVSGHEGRGCRLGPPVDAADPDGRSPAVVTWCHGPLFFLVASTELDLDELLRIAASVLPPPV